MKVIVHTASNFGGLNGQVLEVAEYNGTNGGIMVWVERTDANGDLIRTQTGFHEREIVQLLNDDGTPLTDAASKGVPMYKTPKIVIDSQISTADKADAKTKLCSYIDGLDMDFESAYIQLTGVARGESTLVAV